MLRFSQKYYPSNNNNNITTFHNKIYLRVTTCMNKYFKETLEDSEP